MNLPRSRNANIVVQAFDKETLVYDLDRHKAFRLNETLSAVFNHCDNATTFAELKSKYNFNDDLINLSLDELRSNNLLENNQNKFFTGVSRREVIRRIGQTSMVALPLIFALNAPAAAAAGSCGPCNLPNANSTCVAGTCQITSCFVGFANCDGAQFNGCETNINTDRNNCGSCGRVCPSGQTCSGGTCV